MMTYLTKHGLGVHKGRWCPGHKEGKKPSRKGTVADRIVSRTKVDKYQKDIPKVKLGDKELDNVYSFVYLGAEIAGDGDQEVTVKHRTDIACGRFGEYRKVLTSAKLAIPARIRLYKSLVISTMIYGSSAWLLTERIKQKINGVSSKFLFQITKRSIHEEAGNPTFNVIHHVLKRRWEYLGHILRMDDSRAVRRYLLELSPREAPYVPGSLLDDTRYDSVGEMIEAANNRHQWQADWKRRL